MNITTRLVTGLVFSAVLSGFANAADSATQVTVKYGDLNASNPQDAAVLYNRIHSAAYTVCSQLNHGTLASKRSFYACTSASIADAVGQVNQPLLNALYSDKSGRPVKLLVAAK